MQQQRHLSNFLFANQASELKHLLTNMGDRLSEDDFNVLLEELDIDSSGRIQFKGQ